MTVSLLVQPTCSRMLGTINHPHWPTWWDLWNTLNINIHLYITSQRKTFACMKFIFHLTPPTQSVDNSPVTYGFIFWGNSHYSNTIFRLQKKIIRIIMGLRSRDSCREHFNTFTAIVDLSRFNNSCLKSPASTLVNLTFQSRALHSFGLNQLRNLSL